MTSNRLTAQQVAAYAANAGFTGDDLIIATAIAGSESGYRPDVTGDDGQSIGLWQIDRKYHPEFASWDLTDPQQNANAAFSVYQAAGNSFSPWSSYNSGKYSSFMAIASQAVNA